MTIANKVNITSDELRTVNDRDLAFQGLGVLTHSSYRSCGYEATLLAVHRAQIQRWLE